MSEDYTVKYSGYNYNELAATVRQLKCEKADLDARSRDITKALDYLTITHIPDKLAEDGFRSVNLADGGQIKLSSQAWCSTIDKQKLYEWLEARDSSELITATVNASTLKAFIKEQIAEGDLDIEEIEDFVRYEPYSRAVVTG